MAANIDIDSLEPNSHKYRAEKREREKLRPIINSKNIVSTKKGLFQKFFDSFLNRDINDMKDWLLKDVIIPGIQETLLDAMQMLFFGEVSRDRDRKCGSRSSRKSDYRSCYRGRSSYDSKRERDEDYYDREDKIDYRNIVLKNRRDAEILIDDMRDRIKNLGSVSVADLLDLVDLPGKYTDNNWGWDRENDIGIRRVSGGYLVDVVEPRYLD